MEHAVAFRPRTGPVSSPGRRASRLVAVPPGCRWGWPRGGWADTVLPLPEGATDWHDVITDT